jgi:demethoxyubiquinone hydroxylase (CLK1/Coq7/Cat5 family)
MWEVNFSMSKALSMKVKKDRKPASFNITEYEKTVISNQLEKAVERLKEARREIQQTIQKILRMKEDGDDIADQAIAAIAEALTNDNKPSILSASAKRDMKREAAKPLLLLRAD